MMKFGIRTSNLLMLAACFFAFSSCSDELVIDDAAMAEAAKETQTPLLKNTDNFHLGINGHPLGTVPYKSVSAVEQIRLLKDMGMSIYRFDIVSQDNGKVTVPYLLNPLIEAADDAGVTLLPMLYTKTLDFSVSNSESYQRGKKLGKNFARYYKDVFDYYELGNELDNRCILPNKAGKSRNSYDMKKFKTIAAYLKGMNHGIKIYDPSAKTIINASWLHYAYILMLEDHGIDFDIVGYHWYSDMESVAKRWPYYISDITERLSSRLSKPIWFTEINARPKDVHDMEDRQENFLTSFLKKAKANPQVEAILIYQLFDEPQKNHYQESRYGILKWADPYSDWARKKVAQTFVEIAN